MADVALRPCVVCRAFTDGRCSDCEIDRCVVTPVCDDVWCREAHERRCARPHVDEPASAHA